MLSLASSPIAWVKINPKSTSLIHNWGIDYFFAKKGVISTIFLRFDVGVALIFGI